MALACGVCHDDMLATLEIMSNKETLQNVRNGLNNIDNPDYWLDESEYIF